MKWGFDDYVLGFVFGLLAMGLVDALLGMAIHKEITAETRKTRILFKEGDSLCCEQIAAGYNAVNLRCGDGQLLILRASNFVDTGTVCQ